MVRVQHYTFLEVCKWNKGTDIIELGASVQIVEEYNMVRHTEGTVAHIKTAVCFN